ncbi:MAG: hypothetical protein MUF42_11530 [Cytophagaceae bacterium]|nr:hypothetical protein [Cytophagaceae bacterium]
MKRIVTYSLLFITVIFFWTSANIRYGKDNWKSFIDSDGKGYYSYLPAIFIYQDLNFGFFDRIDQIYFHGRNQDYRNSYNGRYIDKYYCGTALAIAPFFGVGHLLSIYFDQPLDGYSKYYCLGVNFAAIFYTVFSFLFIARWLRFYKIEDKYIALVIVLFSFATNVFYYIVVEASMSHLYSMFFVSVFMYYSTKWFRQPSSKSLMLMGIALGIITIIRPVNVMIVLLLPFLSGSWESLMDGIRQLARYRWMLVFTIFSFFVIIFIQLIFYKIQTGDFIVYSYTNEGFNWFNPQIIKVLFGYRKGLFLYTPLLFISLWGCVYVYKRSSFQFYSLLFFLIILTYVLSSWWCWWYGGSFGMRAFIEFFPIFMLTLSLAFQYLSNRWIKRTYLFLAFLLLIVCQIQTYQFRYYYIHYGEMTKEQYWRVFLRIDWVINGTNKQPTNLPVRLD